ncbi:cytochrome P450 [Streptomyces sp. NPDC006617]|uniref:cytochrome P450 n=1 Tax=Streptomyces sp. NPDC006617 TaxID=3155354 RepID=UPI0033B3ABD3
MTETAPEPVALPTARTCPFAPPEELATLRGRTPVRRLTYPDGTLGWLVTGHAEARSVLGNPLFSSRSELQRLPVPYPWVAEPAAPGRFISMDPPDHTRLRKPLAGLFTVRRMNRLLPRVAEITRERLDAMEAHGRPVDLLKHFALPIPSLVICELLGVPYDERQVFQDNASVLMSTDSSIDQVVAAAAGIDEVMLRTVRRKRSEPADDILGGLVADGDLTDEEIAGIGGLLLVAGHETTANMLTLGTFTLLSHPDQLAALRADPGLMDGTVEELLRHGSILQFGPTRAALADVEVAGRLIRAGEVVTVSLPAANRDPRRFERPEELDITRSAAGHLAFGHGLHQCLGQQLARIELRVGFTALLDRFPGLRLAVPVDDVPLRSEMIVYGVHELPVTW